MDKQGKIEKRALLVGALTYLTMGIFGWYTHYRSNSEAMLLEGNYNMVNAMASFIGYYVVQIRNKKTETFPWGQYLYESLYALVKGILILGILTAALWENGVKIYDYLFHGKSHEVNTGPIYYMVLLSIILCFSLAAYFRKSNDMTNGNSTMLKTDTKAAMIDGYLSLFGGGSLILMIFLGGKIQRLEFLKYIGDALVVLVFELIMIKEPFHIIKENFIELTGGQINSKKDWDFIQQNIKNQFNETFEISHVYVTKTGSQYLILIYLNTLMDNISYPEVLKFKEQVSLKLRESYYNFNLEIII